MPISPNEVAVHQCRIRSIMSLPYTTGFVQALFNDESSPDATLIVDNAPFYCHKAVLQRACQYHLFISCPDEEGGDQTTRTEYSFKSSQE
jgi:hypothetical protein